MLLGKRCGGRVGVHPLFVGDEALDLCTERARGVEGGRFPDFDCAFYRFDGVSRFKGNVLAGSVSLNRQPVNIATFVNAASEWGLFLLRHGCRLLHSECYTFNKNIGYIAKHSSSSSRAESVRMPEKALLRHWLRVRAPPNPPSKIL